MNPVYDASFWNNRYAVSDYVFGTAPNGFLAAVIAQIPVGPVLCLAEGEGRNAVHLARLGYPVTAVDQSAAGLEKAKLLAAQAGVPLSVCVADLTDFPISPDAWSGIVSIFCHLPPVLRRDVHARVVAGLRPGGVFVLEAYHPTQLAFGTGGPKDANLLMTLGLLRSELHGLEFLHARECEREVVEGSGHTGRAAVVQMVARRPV